MAKTATRTNFVLVPRLMLGGALAIVAASCSPAAETTEPAGAMATAGPRIGHAEVDGIKVYYEVHGGDPKATVPFVLLHGGMMAIEMAFADGLLPMLAKTRPVVAIEQQGHGHTADREGPVTLERMVDDTAIVLSHLGVPKAHFVGHSMGAMISLGVAVRHPEKVSSLAPISVVARLEGYLPELVTLQRNPAHVPSAALQPLLPTEADFAAWKAHYDKHNPNPAAFDKVLAKLNKMLAEWKGFSDAELAAIQAPCLLVIGDNDFTRIEHAAEMKRTIPRADLAVLPQTTHMSIIKRGEWLAPMIEAHVSRSDAQPRLKPSEAGGTK
jgi:pimeloyl-ACP methyl ester carboxylesterase